MTLRQGERSIDALVLVIVKLGIGLCVLRSGFTHVSDDDYSRTVIAEQFAHAPRLDPSGTSWLPAPFWIEGTAMLAFGRTLAVARAVAVVLGAGSVALPYLAMRALGMRRIAALLATAFAMTMPWNVWLDVATVPEGWIGAIVAASLLVMPIEPLRPWAAAGLLLGALSRYETWPACATFVVFCVWRVIASKITIDAVRGGRAARELGCATVAAFGPLAWMGWNAWSHGSPLHFVTRVTTFRQSIGAAALPLGDKVLGYPRALVFDMPVAAVFGIAGAIGVLSSSTRRRWTWPIVAALVIFVFLVWGDVRDGAPTHHAARALVAVGWILVAWGVDALVAMGRQTTPERARGLTVGTFVIAAVAAGVTAIGRPRAPGRSTLEDREPQIERGLAMRERNAPSATIIPCSFEHFALLAAWGSPERATVEKRTGEPPTPECPLVIEP